MVALLSLAAIADNTVAKLELVLLSSDEIDDGVLRALVNKIGLGETDRKD